MGDTLTMHLGKRNKSHRSDQRSGLMTWWQNWAPLSPPTWNCVCFFCYFLPTCSRRMCNNKQSTTVGPHRGGKDSDESKPFSRRKSLNRCLLLTQWQHFFSPIFTTIINFPKSNDKCWTFLLLPKCGWGPIFGIFQRGTSTVTLYSS